MMTTRENMIYNKEFNYDVAKCPFCMEMAIIPMPGSEFQQKSCEHFKRTEWDMKSRGNKIAIFYEREECEA